MKPASVPMKPASVPMKPESQRPVIVVGCFVIIFGCIGLGGCVRGARLVSESHASYNEALRLRLDEELLLNLVRLRYRDRPLFLQVSSVIARFEREGSLGVNAGVSSEASSGAAPTLSGGVGVDLGYSEQPTVTFTPLQGEDFAERLLRPIDLETLALLQRSGWSIERVMRLTVQRMNGLDNAAGASGPTPARSPEFREFVEAARALKQLQDQRAVVIGSETVSTSMSDPIPAKNLLASDVLAAARAGHRFEAAPVDVESSDAEQPTTEDGNVAAGAQNETFVVLQTTQSHFVLRVAAAQTSSSTTQRLRQVLGLHPEPRSYDLESAAGAVEDALGPSGERRRIVLVTRSLLGVLFFLCHAVEIPSIHNEEGIVTVTQDESGAPFSWSAVTDGLLRIRSSVERPDTAAIAVPYRGHWFYIDDDDLDSKSTFALLTQLYALQAGDPVTGAAPVPTIPIGG